MKKKRAFTMVELIFVIVILGILAAVAVPKLNASREDAQVAAAVADMRTIWSDIQSYYLANGEIAKDAKIAQMTNVPLEDVGAGRYHVDGADCLRFSTTVRANCITITRAGNSDACIKAVEKAEFLRGHQYYAPGASCSADIQKTKITSLHESLANSGGAQAITLFLGEDGVEW